jgi:hypothetical protein
MPPYISFVAPSFYLILYESAKLPVQQALLAKPRIFAIVALA